MIVFEREYSGESIIDIPEDIGYMFEDSPEIPTDEYGLHQGKFIVTVTWVPE